MSDYPNFEEAIQTLGFFRDATTALKAAVPLLPHRDIKGWTKKEIAPHVIVRRGPSAFIIPERILGDVLKELRNAGYVERVGTRYRLLENQPPEIPAQTIRKIGQLDPTEREPFRALFRDRIQHIIVTNVWGNHGRVHLYVHDRSPGCLEVWTGYIRRNASPPAVDFGLARANLAGFLTRGGHDGFYVGTDDWTQLGRLAEFAGARSYNDKREDGGWR